MFCLCHSQLLIEISVILTLFKNTPKNPLTHFFPSKRPPKFLSPQFYPQGSKSPSNLGGLPPIWHHWPGPYGKMKCPGVLPDDEAQKAEVVVQNCGF